MSDKVISNVAMVVAFMLGAAIGMVFNSPKKTEPVIEGKNVVDIVINENDQAQWKYKETPYGLDAKGTAITKFHTDGNMTDSVKAEIVELPPVTETK